LAAAPAPASSAVLSDLCKGNPNYALSVTLISSIICPLSIPFLINLLTPESVDFAFLNMFWKLFMIIIIPLVISIPIRLFAKKLIDKTKTYYSFANVFFLTIVLFGSIDGLQEKVFSEPEKLPLFMMIALIYFALKFVLSYLLGFWMRPDIKVSYSIVSTFINIGLIIVFAKDFFENTMDGEVLLFIVLTQIIWNLGLFPLQKISLWFIKKTTG
jgi:BASS family bile acid:Na+ symporter